MSGSDKILERIYSFPYWRVVLRPDEYQVDAIKTLSECREIVGKNRVSLRGWDFPHVGTSANPDLHRALNGNSWIGGWSHFLGHIEHWRFYQSKQFLQLFTVREAVEPQWRDKLQETAKSHLSFMPNVDWDNVPGFLGMLNFIYSITEIVEFAARLAQSSVYEGRVHCSIALHGVKGFVLTPDWNRSWSSYCAPSEDSLSNTWTFPADQLVGDSATSSLNVCVWFFERFGWDKPNEGVIEKDILDFLEGRDR